MKNHTSNDGRVRSLARFGLSIVAGLVLVSATSCAGSPTPADSNDPAMSDLPEDATISEIVAAGELRVGMAPAAPWLILDPETDEYIGAAATLTQEIAERLGVEVSYVPVGWDTFVAAIQSNQVDIVAAPLSVTPEREAVVAMVPWSSDGVCFLVKDSSPISTVEDLDQEGVKLGVGQGTLGESIVASNFPQSSTVSRQLAPGEQLLYPELVSGAADAVLVNGTQGQVYLEKYDGLRVVPSDCPATVIAPTDVAVALGIENKVLAGLIKEVVEANRAELDAEFEEFSQADFMNKYA